MARRSERLSLALIAAVSVACLGACTNLESFSAGTLPVPDGSPVALAVQDAIRNPGPIPSFASVPKAPAVLPSDATRLAAERDTRELAETLERQVAAMPPLDPAATEAFAARQRDIFSGIAVPTAAEIAEIEAFARAARARATPPPAPR